MKSDVKTNDAPAGRGLSRRAFGGLTLATLAGAQMAGGPAAAADQLELKMQFASPDGTPWNDMDRRFGKQLEAITGGKMKYFPPNSVTPFKDWLQATGSGLLDIGFVWHPVLPGKFPQMELFGLPGLSKNQTIATIVYWRLRDEFPEMGKLFTKKDNVVDLATFVAMGSHLHLASRYAGWPTSRARCSRRRTRRVCKCCKSLARAPASWSGRTPIWPCSGARSTACSAPGAGSTISSSTR